MLNYDGKFVCDHCVDDEGIRNFISRNAEAKSCTFCNRKSKKPIAAPLGDVIRHIQQGIEEHYDDPANWLPYESAEGGYQGTTYSTSELLTDVIGLELPKDDGTLLEAICDGLHTDIWCDNNPFSLNPVERLSYSWENFCELIKHKRRYFFLNQKQQADDREIDAPSAVLHNIFLFAEDSGLFTKLPAGSLLYRARLQPKGARYKTALELGPPPVESAIQTNRMSPPGIVMMYASQQRATALAETADRQGKYVVGKFAIERDALILDLVNLPRVRSIFEEISDSLEYDPRPRGIFLHEVARDISRPIARDDRAHIEYVPTQVVTEYLRTVAMADGRPIDGIRYRSSRRSNGTSLVLFADQDDLVLPQAEWPPLYPLSQDNRWIKLVGRTVRSVTAQDIKEWT